MKSTLDNTTTVQYAGLMSQLADKARSVVRDLDPGNDLTFLRIRSKKHEIMVAPDKDFILIVIQNPTDWFHLGHFAPNKIDFRFASSSSPPASYPGYFNMHKTGAGIHLKM